MTVNSTKAGVAVIAAPASPSENVVSRIGRRRQFGAGLMFIAPAAVILLVFRVVPVGYGIFYSFTKWNGISAPKFVGWANYAQIFSDPVALKAITNNLILLLTLPLWVFIPMLIAILVWEGMALGKVIRFALIIPILLSPAVLGLYYSLILQKNGVANELLRAIGLGGLTREWLADPHTVVPVFIAIVLWGALGTGTLIFSAGMSSIDDSLYDAADLDGANFWQKHWAVTVPHLRGVASFWSVFVVISFFTGMFPLLFTLTGGGPGYTSTTIDLYIFQLAYNSNDLGYSTALGLATLVLISLLAVIQMRFTRGASADDK